MNETGGKRRRPSTRSAADGGNRRGGGRRGGDDRGGGGPRLAGWMVAIVLVLAVLAGVSWLVGRSRGPDSTSIPTATESATEAPVAGDRSVVLVFPEWDATGYVTETRQIASRSRLEEDMLTVMNELAEGPSVSGATAPLPPGTRPLAAFFDPEKHSCILDFSEELVTRHPGGSAGEMATLTAILRTIALNFPEAESCWILVEGSQVETLAGHMGLERPFDPRRWL
ncbi:MAG: GerMN domain-containing protein [Candidatus Krumholzibacteriia bacterium]